jgi:anti-anti-sigma factor
MARNSKITLKALPSKGSGKSDGATVLSLQGELNIEYSGQIREFLIENLEKYNAFVVKLNNVDSLDVSAIQLLQRFQWDALEQKKKVDFEIKLPEEIKTLIDKSGFSEFSNLNTKQ